MCIEEKKESIIKILKIMLTCELCPEQNHLILPSSPVYRFCHYAPEVVLNNLVFLVP